MRLASSVEHARGRGASAARSHMTCRCGACAAGSSSSVRRRSQLGARNEGNVPHRTVPPTLGSSPNPSDPAAYSAGGRDAAGRILVGAEPDGATTEADESARHAARDCAPRLGSCPPWPACDRADSRSCQRPFSPDGLPLARPLPGVGGPRTGHPATARGRDAEPGQQARRSPSGIDGGRWDAGSAPQRLLV